MFYGSERRGCQDYLKQDRHRRSPQKIAWKKLKGSVKLERWILGMFRVEGSVRAKMIYS